MDRDAVHAEMERARAGFHDLLDHATKAELRRASNGTRWSNRQLLFHMLLGYLIVWALRWLVTGVDRLPAPVGRGFARLLNVATPVFDAANFAGSWLAGTVLPRTVLTTMMDRVIANLHRRLDAEREDTLARSMPFPARWDPFFRDRMSLAELYHYATQHFDFHRRQLTLAAGR